MLSKSSGQLTSQFTSFVNSVCLIAMLAPPSLSQDNPSRPRKVVEQELRFYDYAISSFLSLIRSQPTWAGSDCPCGTSLPSVPPKTPAWPTAISGDMCACPFTSSESVLRVILRTSHLVNRVGGLKLPSQLPKSRLPTAQDRSAGFVNGRPLERSRRAADAARGR